MCAPREVGRCEKPIYTVIRPLGNKRNWWDGKSPAELRQYAPMLIAEVEGVCNEGNSKHTSQRAALRPVTSALAIKLLHQVLQTAEL